MSEDLDKKMLDATSLTVQKYEQAILDLQAEVDPTHIFDQLWDRCLLCEAAKDEDYYIDCHKCILGPEENGCMSGDMEDSYRERLNVNYWEKRDMLRVVKMRLAAIMRQIKKRGYEVSK